MAANLDPIFCRQGKIAWGVLAAANTAKDGTGAVVTVFTADALNGSRIERLRVRAKGTNVATVLRVFINNGADPAVAANNSLYTEAAIEATTLSEIAALTEVEIPMNMVLPAGYRVNVTIGTTVAAGLHVTGIGGDY